MCMHMCMWSQEHGVHSTLWIWRSYRKSAWGFELVHEDESR